MSAKSDYLHWRKQAAVGCVFARMMAARPNEFGQRIEEVSASGTPARTAAAIAKRIDIFVADQNASGAAILLPAITSLKKLTLVALELRSHPKWIVTTTALKDSPVGDMVAVHIVREIPFGDTTLPSEVLVLGPFDEFPATRRAPITAFEIFVGDPLPQDPKKHKPSDKANLAHMDLSDSDLQAPQIDKMWQKSIDGRRRSLGGVDDNRAKAKVSFVISLPLAQKLECAP